MEKDIKRINLNFFQLTPTIYTDKTDYLKQFDAIGKEILSNSSKTFKPLYRSDFTISIHGNIEKRSANYLIGTLVNNQMKDIPPKYDNNTHEISPIDLTDNQGLGHQTSFLFDYQANILMIESVRNGVSLSSWCKFFVQNIDLPKFEPALVINPVDFNRFMGMTVIKKFELKIAKIEDGKLFAGKVKKSLNQIIESADNTNMSVMEYKLTSARNKSLNLSKIKDWVNGMLRFKDTEEVKTLKITGKDDDDSQNTFIDFIQQRLKESIEMEKERQIGKFYFEEKYNKLAEAYDKHRSGILSAYKPG